MTGEPRTRVAVVETGESPFAVRIEMGDHVLFGDEPVRAGGGDLGPSPFDLLTAALAECTAMTVRWLAIQKDWPLEQVEVVVEHVKRSAASGAESQDVFSKTVLIRGTRLSADQRARLMEVAEKCPVHRVLLNTPLITTRAGTPLDETFDT